MRRFFCVLTTSLALILAASAGTATEFRRLFDDRSDTYDETRDGPCAGTLKGTFQSSGGTALPFGGMEGPTLCMDSPGGSLSAALTFPIDDNSWFTRVLPGQKCESACAIAFLKGGYTTGNGVPGFYHDRAIWPGAKLGFHSPGLALPAGVSVQTSDVEKAFKIALVATSSVYDMHQNRDADNVETMNAYLYQRFIKTPPDQMYYIDTVGDALLSGVQVLGVEDKFRLDKTLIRNICDNAYITGNEDFNYLQNNGRTNHESAKVRFQRYKSDMAEFYNGRSDSAGALAGGFETRIELNPNGRVLGYAGHYPGGDYRYFKRCFVAFDTYGTARLGRTVQIDSRISVWFSTGFEKLTKRQKLWQLPDAQPDGDTIRNLSALAGHPFNKPLTSLPTNALYRQYFDKPKGNTPRPSSKSASQKQGKYDRYTGRDTRGLDLFNRKSDSVDGCLRTCTASANCNAVTHDRWNNLCFFKKLGPRETARVLAKADIYVQKTAKVSLRKSSGDTVVKRRVGKRFFADPDDRLPDSSFGECQYFCRNESEGCLAFNFFPATGQCEMFKDPPEYFSSPGGELGFIEQLN